jgi:hypothetical protein
METSPIIDSDQQEKAPTLINHALKWGVIAGAAGIVMMVLLYVFDYTLLVSFKFLGVAIVVSLGIIIYGGIEYRKLSGGYLSYGKAWQHGFVTFAVSGIIGVIFQMIMYNVIDTELPEKMADAIVENTREMMENFGAPADQMDEALEKARTDSLDRFTVVGMLKGAIFQFIGYAIFALITAIFVKKNPPIDQM